MKKMISGYASVFNVIDSQNDVITQNAFNKTLKDIKAIRDVDLLWQHDKNKKVGYINQLYQDRDNLIIYATIDLSLKYGYTAYNYIKRGVVNSFSVGYFPKEVYSDQKSNIRYIMDANLFEISLVTFPANNKARILRID